MRFYSFVNGLYMNSLQYGLQTAHAVSELSRVDDPTYKEWAANHKTIIILDATNLAGLKRALGLIQILAPLYNAHSPEFKIPYVSFHEDEDSLGGIMTCVGAVVPADIYDYELPLDCRPKDVINEFEHAINNHYAQILDLNRIKYLLCCLFKSYNLAPR